MNLSVKPARKGHTGHTDSLLIDLLMLCPHTGFNSTASLLHMTDLNFRVVGCHSESDQAKGNRKSLVDVHHSILTGLEGGGKGRELRAVQQTRTLNQDSQFSKTFLSFHKRRRIP